MAFTKRSIELLLDLVENKISYMDTDDREAARDLKTLKQCRETLLAISQGGAATMMSMARQEQPSQQMAAC
jgi:hypothetical protein